MNSGLHKPNRNLNVSASKGEHAAMQTHQIVGEEVRAAIKRIGGVQPENLPIEEPIERVKKRLAKGVRTENLPLRDREEE
jgi:hypothetical protein